MNHRSFAELAAAKSETVALIGEHADGLLFELPIDAAGKICCTSELSTDTTTVGLDDISSLEWHDGCTHPVDIVDLARFCTDGTARDALQVLGSLQRVQPPSVRLNPTPWFTSWFNSSRSLLDQAVHAARVRQLIEVQLTAVVPRRHGRFEAAVQRALDTVALQLDRSHQSGLGHPEVRRVLEGETLGRRGDRRLVWVLIGPLSVRTSRHSSRGQLTHLALQASWAPRTLQSEQFVQLPIQVADALRRHRPGAVLSRCYPTLPDEVRAAATLLWQERTTGALGSFDDYVDAAVRLHR